MGPQHFLSLVSLVAVVRFTTGFSSGAPTANYPVLCDTLTPQHDAVVSQASTPPYSVTFSSANFTPGGSPVTVTIASTNPATTEFTGFMLTTEHGSFSADSTGNSKLVCTEDKALTHNSGSNKTSLSFQWTPPANSTGHVRFRATFVKTKPVFWVDIPGIPLLKDTTPGATGPATSSVVSGRAVKDPDCGTSKGCYSKCSGTNNCEYVATWAPGQTADSVRITLSGAVGGSNRYVSLGLSFDKEMGDDSVSFCVASGAYNSYNDGKNNVMLSNSTEGLSNVQASLVDGVLTCSFDRLIAADASGRRYALDQQYTLFVAMGPGSAAGLSFHEEIPSAPSQTASLQEFTVDISASENKEVLIKTHGSLMIVAWILAASIGIIVARYAKNLWEDSTIFGQKVWFQIHRTCMVLAFLATAAAFIIIFVDVGGYSEIYGEEYKKAHPILGIIVMVLTLLNPIMALFRPHPGTENRPIFNWAHWAVGVSAYTLGLITIFFGVTLDKAGAPEYMIYILVAFVAWQFLVQVVLEIMQCSQRSSAREITPTVTATSSHPDLNKEGSSERYEMTDLSGNDPGKGSSVKKSGNNKILVIFLHMLVVLGFTIALIIVLNIGSDDHDHDH